MADKIDIVDEKEYLAAKSKYDMTDTIIKILADTGLTDMSAMVANEIAKRDAEIERLKACVSGDCERTKLDAEPCAGCFREHARQEIEKRDALIKKLADTLHEATPICMDYNRECTWCTKRDLGCETYANRRREANAREVVK